MEVIRVDKYGHIQVAKLALTKKDSKADAMIYFFSGTRKVWAVFRNDEYERSMAEEFPNEFYKSKGMVPIYRCYCDGERVAYILPREDDESGHRYLVILRETVSTKSMKKFVQKYYVHSGFDKDFNFIMPTKVTRIARGRYYL